MAREDPVHKVRPEIGQRLRLSTGDITQTMLLYRCPSGYYPNENKSMPDSNR